MTLSLVRRLVSQNRKRFHADGFDLDLTYILPNLIAMGFPAENYERIYRNDISDVVRFFELKHPDHYRIYNLCCERSYDPARFRHNVVVYPFEDHQPPQIELIKTCCDDIHNWLSLHPDNVAAIHCKAGKGRTGLIICSYLLHSGRADTPKEAMEFYARARTIDSHGVTVPSQRRYIHYYFHLLQSGIPYRNVSLQLCRFQLIHNATSDSHPCSAFVFSISQYKSVIWTSEIVPLQSADVACSDSRSFQLQAPLLVSGDILVECYGLHIPLMSLGTLFPRREKIFHFWFNTFFVDDKNASTDQVALSVSRDHLDMLIKDKHWRNFPVNFAVTLWFGQI